MAAKSRYARWPSTLQCLVWALRFLGLYFYKQPKQAAAADSVEISLPLLLWAVFVKTCQVGFTVYHCSLTAEHETGDVGDLATTLNMTFALAFTLLGHTSLLINGSMLRQILAECEQETCQGKWKTTSCFATIFSLQGIISLLFYCSFAVTFLLPLTTLDLEDNIDGTGTAVQVFFYGSVSAGMMVTPMLFREVLAIAARQLSEDFLPDASFLRSSAAWPDPRLDALGMMIRKVELLREKTVDFFLTNITIQMCSCTVTVITYMYTVLRLLMVVSTYNADYWHYYLVYLMVAITTMLHLCYSGHLFSRHVHGVASQLRDLRLAVRDDENRVQLDYLISTLERMEALDMGSWYHLGPNTLVSVTTFVVTYLVVLLQVGNQKTQVEPWPKANTTAE